ncbi:MAG: helix-turn-helix domain-containing protein [Chloroflexota bacterium]
MSEIERGLSNDEGVIETDLRPEFCRYRDEGCELAESCLSCPFPQCLYEQPRGKQSWLKKARAREIVRLFSNKGKSVKELAQMFGVSERTIQRALKKNPSDLPQPLLPVNLGKGANRDE